MRRHFAFDVVGSACAATLDLPDGDMSATGLVIVTGGNEIRSGPHRGLAQIAEAMAAKGHAVLRYDRRGIGDSEGDNAGWRGAADDLAAAVRELHRELPMMKTVAGFGICDGASTLLLHGREAGLNRLILANPWAYDHDGESEDKPPPKTTAPDAAHAKAYYLKRLTNPVALARDLLSGGIDIGKAVRGVRSILQGEQPSDTGARLAAAIREWNDDLTLLMSDSDRTAVHFTSQMKLAKCNAPAVLLADGSHSFTGAEERAWLYAKILTALR